MLVATVLPAAYLPLIRGRPYHMALAHVLKTSAAVRRFYKEEAEGGSYVIMDNGVVETGEAAPAADLLRIARRLGLSEVIAPDVIGQADETLRLSREMVDMVSAVPDAPAVMVVPQGSSRGEWRRCLWEMVSWKAECIGISRFARAHTPDRGSLIEDVIRTGWVGDIHLLGCPEDPLMAALWGRAGGGRVRGIDSGLPLFHARGGIDLELSVGPGGLAVPARPILPDPDFASEEANDQVLRVLRHNLAWWEDRAGPRRIRGGACGLVGACQLLPEAVCQSCMDTVHRLNVTR